MSGRNDGTIALVTGGTRGIGFAIADALATAGASVFVCSRDRGDVAAAVGRLSGKGKASGRECDVRNEVQVRDMLADCESKFGGLDILVNTTRGSGL